MLGQVDSGYILKSAEGFRLGRPHRADHGNTIGQAALCVVTS